MKASRAMGWLECRVPPVALVLVGWGVWLAHPGGALVCPLVLLWMSRFQVQPEERALLARFGQVFEDDACAVRRWV